MTLTVVLSVIVALYLGNMAGKALLSKSHSFASMLADNLNNQIYRRFTLPTVSIFGRVDLNNPEQYRALDRVIQDTIQGLYVEDLRIFSHNKTVRYSTNAGERDTDDLASALVEKAFTADGPIFDVLENMPYWQAFFTLSLPEPTFLLRTTYPLRLENRVSSSTPEGPIMGVLEFTQDITRDMRSTIRFQQLVLGVTLLSSGMLMILLMLLVRRAELALAVRMAEAQRLQQELYQHEKFASMGRVVASIAHEIRNPLGIISSSAELLVRRTGTKDPETVGVLQAIYDEGKRLSRTVSDFMD
jgi:signal transduction histidine kinase